ncbi:MAG TPA: hypothetical protein VEQ67_12495, partial [Mycobacterium sp.]|nr:hypothetical protein [Mycobacterium sp.]
VMRSTRGKSEKQIRESKSEKASPRSMGTADVSDYQALSLFCIAAETNVAATAAENVTTSLAVLNT